MISFTVPGDPVAWARVRMNRKTGAFFNTQKTTEFKTKLAVFAKEAGVRVFDYPVHVMIKFYAKRPQRLMRAKDSADYIANTSRPDLDNLIKNCLDGLIGIAWNDDALVYRVTASKWYHEKNGVQRTEITII